MSGNCKLELPSPLLLEDWVRLTDKHTIIPFKLANHDKLDVSALALSETAGLHFTDRSFMFAVTDSDPFWVSSVNHQGAL